MVRRAAFSYQTPSDALLVVAGRWLDASLPSMPGRTRNLLAAYHSGKATHCAFTALRTARAVAARYSRIDRKLVIWVMRVLCKCTIGISTLCCSMSRDRQDQVSGATI